MIKLYTGIAILGLMTMGLGSCQKEKNTIPDSLKLEGLTGKWYLKTLLIRQTVDTSLITKTDSSKSFTAQDYFEFKNDNAATYSSTIIGKMYDGYYSANSVVTPQTLTFKSRSFINKFNISKLSKDSLVIYQSDTTKIGFVTKIVSDYYIYTH